MLRNFENCAIEFREILELPVRRDDFYAFNPLSFKQLSEMIRDTYSNIEIISEDTSDAYMVKYIKNSCENKNDDGFKIYIGQKLGEEGCLSALVHELAHIFFHRREIPYDVPIGNNLGTWKQEVEANYFSRAFLVPEELFRKALSIFSRNDGTVDLTGFANYFGVEKNVIVSRGNDLKVW